LAALANLRGVFRLGRAEDRHIDAIPDHNYSAASDTGTDQRLGYAFGHGNNPMEMPEHEAIHDPIDANIHTLAGPVMTRGGQRNSGTACGQISVDIRLVTMSVHNI